MRHFTSVVALAATVTGTLLLSIMAVGGLVQGWLRLEPSQSPIVFREHPVRFVAAVLGLLIGAFLFALATVRIASGLLR